MLSQGFTISEVFIKKLLCFVVKAPGLNIGFVIIVITDVTINI